MENGSLGFAKSALIIIADCARLSALLLSNSAESANGQCRWEGGLGAEGGKAKECVVSGGLAQCSAGTGAAPDGWNDSELGPEKWLYSIWLLAAGKEVCSHG